MSFWKWYLTYIGDGLKALLSAPCEPFIWGVVLLLCGVLVTTSLLGVSYWYALGYLAVPVGFTLIAYSSWRDK